MRVDEGLTWAALERTLRANGHDERSIEMIGIIWTRTDLTLWQILNLTWDDLRIDGDNLIVSVEE